MEADHVKKYETHARRNVKKKKQPGEADPEKKSKAHVRRNVKKKKQHVESADTASESFDRALESADTALESVTPEVCLSTGQPVATDTSPINATATGQTATDTSNVPHLIRSRIATDINLPQSSTAEKLLHIFGLRTAANSTDLNLLESSTAAIEELQHIIQTSIENDQTFS